MPNKVKDSITVFNDPVKYPFRLECDDIKGIIRLHKNICTDKFITVTRRNILVTDQARVSMNEQRSGYYEENSGNPFVGSYISKEMNPDTYDVWLHTMYKRYSEFKEESKRIMIENGKVVGYQPDIFDILNEIK